MPRAAIVMRRGRAKIGSKGGSPRFKEDPMTVQNTIVALREHPLQSLRAAALRGLNAVADASTVMACARQAEYLMSLSDAELAARGLTRDRVVHHAFARYMGV